MVSLLVNRDAVFAALNNISCSDCVKHTILLYLNSYGTDYEFAQFYVQYNDDKYLATAVVFRYNETIYVSACDNADYSELSGFLQGFSGYTAVCDSVLQDKCTGLGKAEICAVMSKLGSCEIDISSAVVRFDDAKIISELVTQGCTKEEQLDFFLNTSHQLRHNCIHVYAYMVDEKPVSTVSVTSDDSQIAVIPFVYTHKHFRGNGYSREVLSAVCSDPAVEYRLLCEEHNIKFYEKCGFTQIGSWVRYRL